MNTPREEARAWLQRTLVASFPDQAAEHAVTLEEYGDSLFAIAGQFEIPDETLLFWISDRPPWKDWSVGSFRRYAESYADTRARVGQTMPEPVPDDLGARKTPETAPSDESSPANPRPTARLCGTCYAAVALRLENGRWWCAKCGEVQE